ncbi:unnamed protein product [Aspergillus oryzae]|uniref:Unnamed protein product n=2 Tax=Aspergillus oryzae TaxID=5062 RepID=A0AAN5C3Y1_ASPOZ|nr:unnamed protein product [Aspergillus oryzae]GMF91233.1 unnamed protein product [Aspergillus oryzae]GMG17480.1 unnamed protein product [Aspergillus oryzae]GMG39143.1 unnamed protein product [Aspergillus oryzae]GMG49194.1 unnamed protein product [Aspergillus oryzae var. brunneus]
MTRLVPEPEKALREFQELGLQDGSDQPRFSFVKTRNKERKKSNYKKQKREKDQFGLHSVKTVTAQSGVPGSGGGSVSRFIHFWGFRTATGAPDEIENRKRNNNKSCGNIREQLETSLGGKKQIKK